MGRTYSVKYKFVALGVHYVINIDMVERQKITAFIISNDMRFREKIKRLFQKEISSSFWEERRKATSPSD